MQQIGPYSIESELGRGGMGVVYRAIDPRLNRPVAIKALPPELGADPARLDRFEREARTLAQLNHPNLAGIHGLEEHDGAKFLILEFVEGDTLADRLDRGPLPLDDALELAAQIAAGIEAAHDAGIIHRDLKPANIILTPDGSAKVLDFGLARADNAHSSTGSGMSQSPTMTVPIQHSPTIPGAILGTAAYMSPEQARGRSVDRRTDIWSFGVILFEMLCGANPFAGETASDSIGAVIHKDFNLDALPQGTPADLRRLLGRCLTRDKNRRLQSVADARVELQDLAARLESGQLNNPDSSRPASKAGLFWPVLALLSLVACVALATLYFGRPPAGDPALAGAGVPAVAPTPSIAGVSRLTDFPEYETDPALSPDGRTLVYAARDGDNLDLYALRVGGSNPINLTPNSEQDDFDPVFSPDGERIAFVSSRQGGGIFVMGATGENPRRITEEGFAPAWSPDGTKIVYTTDHVSNPFGRPRLGRLKVLDLATGQSAELDTTDPTIQDQSTTDAVAPAWSPDGRHIAFWGIYQGQRDLYTVPAEGGERTPVTNDIPTDWDPMWSADSRSLIFLSDRSGERTLWAIPLDEQAAPAGDPVPLMRAPVTVGWAAKAPGADRLVITSRHGSTAIYRAEFDPETERFTSSPTRIFATSQPMRSTSASPDGRWLVYSSSPPEEDIYVIATDGSGRTRLTQDPYKSRGPVFSRDAQTITYYSNRTGAYAIWQMDRNGNDQRVILEDPTGYATPIWTEDDQTLATMRLDQFTALLLHRRTPDGELELIYENPGDFTNPISWSPSGTRLLGLHANSQGQLALAAFDPESEAIMPIHTPAGRADVDQEDSLGEPGWIDNDRLLMWDGSSDSFFVFDFTTLDARWVESSVADFSHIIKVLDGTTVFFSQEEENSDLWLVELDAAQPRAGGRPPEN